MPRNLYVNLAVKDLERTVDFFAALGFSFDPKFTDENATCMIVNDSTSVMLLVESYFATFTRKPGDSAPSTLSPSARSLATM